MTAMTFYPGDLVAALWWKADYTGRVVQRRPTGRLDVTTPWGENSYAPEDLCPVMMTPAGFRRTKP